MNVVQSAARLPLSSTFDPLWRLGQMCALNGRSETGHTEATESVSAPAARYTQGVRAALFLPPCLSKLKSWAQQAVQAEQGLLAYRNITSIDENEGV